MSDRARQPLEWCVCFCLLWSCFPCAVVNVLLSLSRFCFGVGDDAQPICSRCIAPKVKYVKSAPRWALSRTSPEQPLHRAHQRRASSLKPPQLLRPTRQARVLRALPRPSVRFFCVQVIVHETLGRGQTPRDTVPPSVPVGPSSPRPGLASAGGFGGGGAGGASPM